MGREEHITLDVIDHVMPPLGQRLVRSFAQLVVGATALAVAYEGYDIFASGSPIKSPAAGIPLGWIYLLPTIGMVLTGCRALLLVFVPGTRPHRIAPDASGAVPTPYRHPESTEESVA
jgi:TRAP-type C4-dicarboxylate transport system permease small subunit